MPIHQIEYLDQEWQTASRLARDGSDWIRIGVDRQRFRDRVERTAEILNRILDFEFRQQIYRERFEKFRIPSDAELKSQRHAEINDIKGETTTHNDKRVEIDNKPKSEHQENSPDQYKQSVTTNAKTTKKKSNRRKPHKRGGARRKNKRKNRGRH